MPRMSKMEKLVNKFTSLLSSEPDLKVVGNAFYDLAELDEFLSLGEPVDKATFVDFIGAASSGMFGREMEIVQPLCIYVKEFGIYHGAVLMGSYNGTMVYDEKLKMGLLIVFVHDTGETRFARMTGVPVEIPEGAFVANPASPATD